MLPRQQYFGGKEKYISSTAESNIAAVCYYKAKSIKTQEEN